MQVHSAAGNVRSHHFEIWLAQFDTVLAEELPAALAQSWSRLAHRIGRGLSYGVARGDATEQVPHLG